MSYNKIKNELLYYKIGKTVNNNKNFKIVRFKSYLLLNCLARCILAFGPVANVSTLESSAITIWFDFRQASVVLYRNTNKVMRR